MNMTDMAFDQNEQQFPSFEVSDEALEGAAATGSAAPLTIGDCSALSYCPEY